uniref:ADAM metallopeptidase with thrombospondin type 1 motif 17 n=1 Tax=Paramormyrops kingsleyae TaxID=1676925 RepID=A0A3B3TC47_9TELE
MCDSLSLRLLILSSLLLSFGLSAVAGKAGAALVVPVRLTEDEVHLLMDAAGRSGRGRGRRSLSQQGSRSLEQSRDLFLLLPAFGTDLFLQLRKDAGFLSEDFVIEEMRDNGTAPAKSYPGPSAAFCFYTGRVLNHTGSFATLSTCGGLTGWVQTEHDSMFIEPTASSGTFAGVEHRVVRRRRSPTARPPHMETEMTKHWKKERKTKEWEDRRERRNAIRRGGDYTVETVVVADSDMVAYHGPEAAQRFILTVMNMVYNMFRHKSLGVSINIRVTKLVLLHSRPEKLRVGHHGERSLESFCHWQHEEFGGPRFLGNNHVPGGRDDPPPMDVAVFVTRTDFCVHKDEPCDTVGIAYLGGACSAKRKCVLAEDNGLNLAFTIAHELGHNMGMSHDDDHATCTGHSHIMSGEWVKGRNPSDLSWSTCSREDLENFLRSKASACLLQMDPRSPYMVRLPPKLPGMHYSADGQCQILFGTNATFCQDMEHLMCAGLWCLVEGDTTCKTTLDPPLDGTECGADKWCRAGDCVSKTPIPQHLDGDWGPWGPWSMCSRTCGTGVRFRQRKCDNPPPGPGGRHCQKASVEHKACEAPPCAKGLPTFRDQQCQAQERQAAKRKAAMWTAVVNDEKPCVLFCTPVGHEVSVLVAERVLDGTPCGPYETDLCVNGKCQKIGCDGIIGSSAKEDRCGVCNGDGKSCKIVKGDFNHTKGMASLHDSQKSLFVLHYLWLPSRTPFPTLPQVLLFHDQTYGIHYEYTVSLSQTQEVGDPPATEPTHLYIWTHSGWEDCSVQCGGGERKTVVSCMKIVNKTMALVNDSHCNLENRLAPQTTACNMQSCQSRFLTSGWGPCSVSCGKGLQLREVMCIYQLQNGSYVNALAVYCPGPKPSAVRTCETRHCGSMWEASEWSKCSSHCGQGTRRRTITCTNPHGRVSANMFSIGIFQCSSSCGRGLQSRVVQCMHRVTGRHGSDCAGVLKPPAYRQCHQGACNEKVNVNTITSPRLAALTYKCAGDQWAVYCRVVREKNLCQDMRWYQRCCQTCRDFYANKMPMNS